MGTRTATDPPPHPDTRRQHHLQPATQHESLDHPQGPTEVGRKTGGVDEKAAQHRTHPVQRMTVRNYPATTQDGAGVETDDWNRLFHGSKCTGQPSNRLPETAGLVALRPVSEGGPAGPPSV